jgi:O-antigen/teichoic acid export membrane protein
MRQDLRAWQALSAQAAAGFLVFLAVFARKIHYRKLLDVGRALDIAKRILLGRYKYLFVYFTVLAVFSQLDVFMLKSMGTDMMVATYGTAYRYYAMILLTLGAIHTVFLPMIQQAGSSRELDGIFKKQWRMVAFLAPAILVGAWLAQWILPFIDMGKYPRAVPVFRILCVSAIISLAFSPYVNLVMRFEEFPFLLGLVLVGCVVSAGMNMVLVPRLQEIGTAISTLVSFLIVNGLTFLKAMKLRRALDVPGGPPPGAVVQTE